MDAETILRNKLSVLQKEKEEKKKSSEMMRLMNTV